MTLSVKPYSKMAESLISYLLRLIVRNGFDDVIDYFSPRDIKEVSQNRLSPNKIDLLSNDFSNFKEFAQFDHDEINHPIFKRNHIHTPRICPECTIENGILFKSWQIATTIYCKKHNSLLIDTCSHCTIPLIWKEGLLEGKCTNDKCYKPLLPLTPNQELLTLDNNQILDCFTAAYFAENVATTRAISSVESRFDSHLSSLIKGYKLLSRNDAAQSWYAKCNEISSNQECLPSDFKNLSASLLMKLLKCEWPIKSFERNESKNPKEPHLRLIRPTKITLPLKEACKILGYEKCDFKKWFDVELLTISNSALNQHSYLDFSPLFVFLTSTSTAINKSMRFYDLKSIVPTYFIDFTELLVACKQEKVAFNYIPAKDLQDSIFFEVSSVRSFIESHINSVKDEITKVSDVMNLTNMTSEEMSYAIKNKIVSKPRLYKHSPHLKNKDLIRLIKMKNVRQLELNIF